MSSEKDPRDWSTDLLLAGAGAIVGILFGINWKPIPVPSMITCLGAAAFFVPMFVIVHYVGGKGINWFMGRVGQLLVGVIGGFMLALIIRYP